MCSQPATSKRKGLQAQNHYLTVILSGYSTLHHSENHKRVQSDTEVQVDRVDGRKPNQQIHEAKKQRPKRVRYARNLG